MLLYFMTSDNIHMIPEGTLRVSDDPIVLSVALICLYQALNMTL